MKQHTREKWLNILNRFINSEQSFDDFARANQLNSGTLRQYYYLLRKDLAGERKTSNKSRSSGSKNKNQIQLPEFPEEDDISNETVQYFLPRFVRALKDLQEAYSRQPNKQTESLPSIAMFGKALVSHDRLKIPRLKYLLEPIVSSLEDGYLGHKDPHKAIELGLERWRTVEPEINKLVNSAADSES